MRAGHRHGGKLEKPVPGRGSGPIPHFDNTLRWQRSPERSRTLVLFPQGTGWGAQSRWLGFGVSPHTLGFKGFSFPVRSFSPFEHLPPPFFFFFFFFFPSQGMRKRTEKNEAAHPGALDRARLCCNHVRPGNRKPLTWMKWASKVLPDRRV